MEYSKIEAARASDALHITGEQKPIATALRYLARNVIERRNTIPILSNVRIESGPDGVRFTGSNLDIWAAVTVPTQCEGFGETTADAVTLADIARKASGLITLRQHDGRLNVSSGRTSQRVATLPADDFPKLKHSEAPTVLDVPADQLAHDLGRVRVAISTEETRYYLNGVFLHPIGGNVIMAATDGHRLSIITRPHPIGGMEWPGVILPRQAVKAILAAIKEFGIAGPVTLSLGTSQWRFEAGPVTLWGKLIDGTFPDYSRVIPPESGHQHFVSILSAELQAKAKAAKTGAKSPALCLELAADGCRAGQGPDGDHGDGWAQSLSAEYEGPGTCAAFNPSYLADFAGVGKRLQMAFADPGTPCRFSDLDAPEWLGVLMPVRVDAGLPAPVAVRYREVMPAPGQAKPLFDIERGCSINEGPRKATDRERMAYLVDYAERCGLPSMKSRAVLHAKGITFGKISDEKTVYPVIRDKWGAERPDHSQPGVYHPAEFEPGAYSIPMPGLRQAPVTMETLGDDGEWSAPVTCTNAKGDIALPDAKRDRKAPKVKIGRKMTEREIRISNALSAGLDQDAAEREADEAMEALSAKSPADAVKAAIVESGGEIAREAVASGRMIIATMGFADAKAEILPSEAIPAVDGPVMPPDPEIALSGDEAKDMRQDRPRVRMRLVPVAIGGDALATLTERLDAVESALTERKAAAPVKDRSPARVRLLSAYVRMRKERAILRTKARQSVEQSQEIEASLRECWESDKRASAENYAYAMRLQAQLRTTKARRARAIAKAQAYRRSAWEMAHAVATAVDRITAIEAELQRERASVPLYNDPEGRTQGDAVATAQRHAQIARDRGDTLSAENERLQVAIAGMQARIDQMADQMMDATGRALRAETALAAATARVNGWPPAVARVNFEHAA
jgi:DNA polymerase III subunit beta